MKKSRLLEIIREEINEALNVLVTTKDGKTTPMPYNTQDEKESIDVLKQDSNITNIKTTAGKNIKEEEQLNERPFIDSAFDVTGTSPENLNQDSLQKAIDDAVKVLQKEYPDADVKKLAGELQKVNSAKNLGPNSKLSSEVKSALQKVADVIEKQGQIFGSPSKIDDLIKLAKDPSQIDRLEKLKSKGYTFILGNPQAVTAIEKSLGLKPKNNDSLLADKSKTDKLKTDKPKAEKPAKEKTPKAKVATRTPGDDGFDKVSYSDDEESAAASKSAGSDKTAKELGKEADVSKNPDFDRIRKGLQNKRKNSKDGILSPEDMKLAVNIINTAKDKYKFNTTQVDSLRADIGL
jgi:hypothetical protein